VIHAIGVLMQGLLHPLAKLLNSQWGTVAGVWIAALLTLAILSFLYKDNALYKFGEHLFVGVSTGYIIAITYWNGLYPNLITPLMHRNFWVIIPGVLGLFWFAPFVTRKYAFLMKIPIAFIAGYGSGVAIPAIVQASILAQMYNTMNLPLSPMKVYSSVVSSPTFHGSPYVATFLAWSNNMLIVIGVIATLIYFFFSVPHKGVVKGVANVGMWFLMISFGASFGYSVMARLSLLIGRMEFLLGDWLHLIRLK